MCSLLNLHSLFAAHGTGTSMGDSIELQAIKEVYTGKRDDILYLSSVKAVIGHTEECAGLAGKYTRSRCIMRL
jgi:acyl transferase domain-containing protein